MVEIELSIYGDTLVNSEAELTDILVHDCIGHHSCGTANIGNLNLDNFSKTYNVIICSNCKENIKVPKSIETYQELKTYLENKHLKMH